MTSEHPLLPDQPEPLKLAPQDIEKQLQSLRKQVAQVQSRMNKTQDYQTLLNTTIEQVQHLLQSSRTLIYQFQNEQQGIAIAETLEKGWTPAHQESLPATFFGADTRHEYDRGCITITYVANPQVTPYQLQLLEKYQVRSSLATPVRLESKVWGLLVTQQCNEAREWGEIDQMFLEQVATAFSVHLVTHQYQEKLQQQHHREQAVNKVIDRIRRSVDIKTIFQNTTQEVRDLLNADRVLIYRFNADWTGQFMAESVGGRWETVMQNSPNGQLLQESSQDCNLKEMSTYQGRGEIQDTFLEKTKGGGYNRGEKYRVVDDIYNMGFPPCYLELLERFQAKSYVIVGIYQGNRLWGLFASYQCSDIRHWQADDINLMMEMSDQLGVAVQQAVAQKQQQLQAAKLQQAIEREKAIALVSDRIKQSLDTSTIFRTATEEIRKLLKSDRVVIYRFTEDWAGEFVAESVGTGWNSLLEVQEEDSTLLEGTKININTQGCTVKNWRVWELAVKDTYLQQTRGGTYRQGEKFRATEDIYKAGFPPCYLELLEALQARAYITVPIFSGDTLWGLLANYQCSGPREWQNEEINLVINLGSQLGIALQRAADLEKVHAQTEKLAKAVERERAIAKVSDKIQQFTDTQSIFKVATEEVRKLLKSDRVGVYRFNPDWSGEFVAESVASGWLSLLTAQREDENILQGTKNNIDTQGCTITRMRVKHLASLDTYLQETQGGMYRKGEQFRVSNDIYKSKFPDCYIELLESFQAKAYITVPIFLGDQLWGLLANYQCSEARVWADEEIQLMVNLGSQLGIALQRGLDIENLKLQTQELEKAVERERAIAIISDKIKQSTEIKTIFRITTTEARKVFNSDRVGIYRFNSDWSGEFVAESVGPGWISLLGTQEEDPSLLEKTRTNIETEGCTIKDLRVKQLASTDTYLQDTQGGMYRKGEQFRVSNDIYQSNFPPCYIELLESFQAKAYMTVPIFQGNKLWGLLANYQCSGPRHWEDTEIKLMVQLGAQLGIALQRAEDLQKLHQQADQLAEAAAREKTAREQLQQRALQLLTAVHPALKGDLTVRAPLSEDELGTIADVYNNTLNSLRKIVIQVQQTTGLVMEKSAESDVQIRELAKQAQRQAEALNEALGELQRTVSLTQEVNHNAASIEEAVQNANHTVKTGDQAMNRTVEGILAIRDTVSEASEKIQELSESSQKIDRVVNLISDFATQTQLLSLNAAIEATRAGEYGKGFAVVADEVRSLARQSANATSDISSLVAEIRKQTSEVIKVTEMAITQVMTGTHLVEETKGNLTAIAAATAQISTLVEGITTATTVQLKQSESVTKTMQEVAEIANSTSASSTTLSDTVQDSLATTQQLQEVVRQFKVN